MEKLVQVPRQRDNERHRGEDRDSAPRAAPAAPRRREREARDEEHEGLLAQHPETDGDARERRDAWAREALRGENRPSRHCHHRRLGRVEHELVELFDHERRAEREHDGQQARQWAERETPDVVAAEREQRHEHDVQGDDRGRHADPADEDSQGADQNGQRRIGRCAGERFQ